MLGANARFRSQGDVMIDAAIITNRHLRMKDDPEGVVLEDNVAAHDGLGGQETFVNDQFTAFTTRASRGCLP